MGLRAHGIHRSRVGMGQGAVTSRQDYSPARGHGVPNKSRRGSKAYLRELREAAALRNKTEFDGRGGR